jgi:pimeloyl-ACP methyl ester carboxylesterase
MSGTTEMRVLRTEVQVEGETASYLTVEQDGPAVLLLHGTYWSQVWLPVLGRLAEAGLRPLAVDLPGLGRSGGELTPGNGHGPSPCGLGSAIRVRAEALRADRRGGP